MAKVYELYWNGMHPTPKSQVYGGSNKGVTHVAAVSIKQAVYLAANDIWFNGNTGILEDTKNAAETQWKRYDGTQAWGPHYKHGRVAKPIVQKEKEARQSDCTPNS